jgi:hypothetical protein
MFSAMMSAHPDVLSISEFWNCFFDTEGSIPAQAMTGREFWCRIAAVSDAYDGLVRAGMKTAGSFASRFDHDSGVPYFCRVIALTTSQPPDPLYDQLAAEVARWPSRTVARHCRALFEAMAGALGRRVIVERTGGSLKAARTLRAMFPDARFLFLYRNPPDTVLSMSRYPPCRLSMLQLIAGAVSGTPEYRPLLQLLPASVAAMSLRDLESLMTPPFDRDRFLGLPIPLSCFGASWTEMIRRGTREIGQVPGQAWMPLRYERLVSDAAAELTRVAEFIGVPAHQKWLDGNRALADQGRVGSAAAQLYPFDLAVLRAVCSPGERAFDLLESEYVTANHSTLPIRKLRHGG